MFVLSTGRCGSMTFANACQHMDNYTAAHESKAAHIKHRERFNYPVDHVEVDNRLSWFLGTLDRLYGKDAFYVHLYREPEQVARSYAKRFNIRAGIMNAYSSGIIRAKAPGNYQKRLDAARSYVTTVNDNITQFLSDKNQITMNITDKESFIEIWDRIGAHGDLTSALMTLEKRYNVS